MSDELRKELREVQAEQAEWAKVEGEAEHIAQFTRPGSLWHRFFLWIVRKARTEREDCARVRREIEDEMRGG